MPSITSPISGKVGRTNITKGNVVTPQSGPLTVIVSQDPMYVTFPVSQREFLRAQQAGQSVDVTGIKAALRFADGSAYKYPGKINFVDVTVDRATDTVLARASFPNPDSGLIDGQLVRVALESGSRGGKDRYSAGGADFRPGRRLRLHRERRKSGGTQGQDRRSQAGPASSWSRA